MKALLAIAAALTCRLTGGDESADGGGLSAKSLATLCDLGGDLKQAAYIMSTKLKAHDAATQIHLKKLRILDTLEACTNIEHRIKTTLARLMLADYIQHTTARNAAAETAVGAAAESAYWPGRLDELVAIAKQSTTAKADGVSESICLANVEPGQTTAHGIKHDDDLATAGLQGCKNTQSTTQKTATAINIQERLNAIGKKNGIYATFPANPGCILTKKSTAHYYKTLTGPATLTFAGGSIQLTAQSGNAAPTQQSLGVTQTGDTYSTAAGTGIKEATDAASRGISASNIDGPKTEALLADGAWETAKNNKLLQEALNPHEDVSSKYNEGLPESSKPLYSEISKLHKKLGTTLEALEASGDFETKLRAKFSGKKTCKQPTIEVSAATGCKQYYTNTTCRTDNNCKWDSTTEDKGEHCKPKDGEEQTNTAGGTEGAAATENHNCGQYTDTEKCTKAIGKPKEGKNLFVFG
uniref:Variant surface glycoprotein 1125.1161 n=1 Tax=Trypanosoma brucei TaxID=5691 RepID=A0A1J0R6D0_9TRYP|nr:variant surface glycoprotein 1125.1161 [Trypanosoma brucei]